MGYSYFIPSSSSSIIPILIITWSLLIPNIAFPINDTELAHICLNNTKPFTIAYNQSRALVVAYLMINSASHGGFSNANYTWYKDPKEWAYGLALCRGDVSPDDCKTCVINAALAVIDTDHCSNNRSAIIWHDYCFLKYSDVDFFGKIDTDNKFSSMSNNTWKQADSKDAARGFMIHLSQMAMLNSTFYAQNISDIKEATLYGVAQCTRDLSAFTDCKTCLESAVTNLDGSHTGEIIAYGSCNLRYETYNFLSD